MRASWVCTISATTSLSKEPASYLAGQVRLAIRLPLDLAHGEELLGGISGEGRR